MKNLLTLAATLSAVFVLLFSAPGLQEGCRGALKLCGELIVPSLFPFFVLSILLSRLGLPYYLEKLLGRGASRLFGVSGAGIGALFVGLCGGYPLGAAFVAELYQQGSVSRAEAERLLAFCNNSGPAFIVSAVGVGVFGSVRVGLLLYGCHVLAAVLLGLLLRRQQEYSPASAREAPRESFAAALPAAVKQAVGAVLQVCGFVVCFTALTALWEQWGLTGAMAGLLSRLSGQGTDWCRALLAGILELGSGAAALRGLPPNPANLALAAALLGWGGVSVHFQTAALFADSEIKGALHTAGRLLAAAMAAALAFFSSVLLFS